MMDNRKRTVSLILALLMVFLSAAPSFADSDSPNISMTVDNTSVQIGDTVTVTLKVVGQPELAVFTGGISFNRDIFECAEITNGNGEFKMELQINDGVSAGWSDIRSGAQSNVSDANSRGTVGFSFIISASESMSIRMKYSALCVVKFTAKAAGEAVFSLYESSATYPAGGASAYDGKSFSPVTVTVGHEHALSKVNGSTPGCEHGGKIDHWVCSICGKYFSDAEGEHEISPDSVYIPELGHSWGEPVVEKEATCTEPGKKVYTCTQCYVEKKEEEIPALGHDWDGGRVTKEPTCTEAGEKTFTCTRCNAVRTEEGAAALGHDYKIDYSWNRELTKVTATATCRRDTSHRITETANVEKRESLAGCGQSATVTYTVKFTNPVFTAQTRTETIDSVPHQLKKTDAAAPGCKKPGNTEYYTCTVCGKIFRDADGKEAIKIEDTVVEAAGHAMTEEPEWKWADGDSKASATFTCSRCGEVFTVEAKVSKSYNVVTASVKDEAGGRVFTDAKHVDSVSNRLTHLEAAAGSGQKLAVEMSPVASAELLTPETVFARIDTQKVLSAKLEQFTVLWQRDIKVPEGSGKVTLTLTSEGISDSDELIVFHRDAEKGWQMVGYERGAQQVTVTLDSLSPLALVKRSGAPAKDAPRPEPDNTRTDTGSFSKLLENKLILIVAAVVLVILIAAALLMRKKGKHSK